MKGNCYFCKLFQISKNMKKVVFAVVVCLSLMLSACKHKVETTYTIGCLGFQYTNIEDSDWQAIDEYLKANVDYNKQVTFEGVSLSENDAQARSYFYEQESKLDEEYICSKLKGMDFYIYGIATLNADGSYRNVAGKKFTAIGSQDIAK